MPTDVQRRLSHLLRSTAQAFIDQLEPSESLPPSAIVKLRRDSDSLVGLLALDSFDPTAAYDEAAAIDSRCRAQKPAPHDTPPTTFHGG